MTNSREPSFDTLLRRHLGRQLRADGFKLVRSRTYQRVVGDWTQEVYIQRFTGHVEFAAQLSMSGRDVGGRLTARYSEDGRGVTWSGIDFGFDLEKSFCEAERTYCTRIRPLLDGLVAAESPLKTISARELAALGARVGPFHRCWMTLEMFASLRWRDGRLEEAKDFAKSVLAETYLADHHKSRARFILEQIDAGLPYTRQ